MIHIHDAIRALNPSIVTIDEMNAFDFNGQPVEYDLAAAEEKLAELQAAEDAAKQAVETHKQNALAKLMALGLTEEEALALGVK
jgi:hypothetical protein